MINHISVREAVSEADISLFWEQLYAYFKRDIFPDPEEEDREYFLSNEYRSQIQKLHDRQQDRCFYLYFCHDGQETGFALTTIYTTEDGKCFIMEFCVYPEFRGSGTGRACAAALLNWARENSALYAELNYGGQERRLCFWRSVGFFENGVDEWGEPLMILPPKEDVPVTVEILSDPEDWQLRKLENGFLKEIGEEALTEERQMQLSQALRDCKIFFSWRADATAPWGCAVWQDIFLRSRAPMSVYLRISTSSRCFAKRALPENWQRRHRGGVKITVLQV